MHAPEVAPRHDAATRSSHAGSGQLGPGRAADEVADVAVRHDAELDELAGVVADRTDERAVVARGRTQGRDFVGDRATVLEQFVGDAGVARVDPYRLVQVRRGTLVGV